MKTVVIKVNSSGTGMQDALDLSENLAADVGLSRSENLRLRLLAEELFGMLRSIAGGAEASYWIEYEGKSFTIHLDTDIPLSQERRKHLLSVSTSGTNSEAKGIMGKIKDVISSMLLPSESPSPVLSMGLVDYDSVDGYYSGLTAYDWSLNTYRSEVEQGTDDKAKEAWDELEKSIIANIADEVKIGIKGSSVNITVYKKF